MMSITANHPIAWRSAALLALALALTLGSTRLRADTGACGGALVTLPFTDVAGTNLFFCAIAQAYFTGLTNGTSATTYSPSSDVTREQMAAFVTRTLDQSLRRGSRRAAAQQWWQPRVTDALGYFDSGGSFPQKIAWDGADLWVANRTGGKVTRVRASDGALLGTWTSAVRATAILIAGGRVFITGLGAVVNTPGNLYQIDPGAAPGPVVDLADTGLEPTGLTCDGANLWTANFNDGMSGGSITRYALSSGSVSTFAAGFMSPVDILWDGANLWVADHAADQVRRVDPTTGVVLGSTATGDAPNDLLFDGANLWVSNIVGDSITIIRAVGGLRGTALATLTGNGLNGPAGMAFDGERVLVTNYEGRSVSLFKAADFTPLGSVLLRSPSPHHAVPRAACSDGLNFFITVGGVPDYNLVRY